MIKMMGSPSRELFGKQFLSWLYVGFTKGESRPVRDWRKAEPCANVRNFE